MLLTKEERALLALVSAGLWERTPDWGEIPPLTPDEWRNVWRMARQQTVVGIAYRGLIALPAHLLPPNSILFRWVAETDRIEARSLRHNEAIRELVGMFRSRGLNPVLLKGQAVASFYEWPLLREAGDIDLYFSSPQEREKATAILRNIGFAPTAAPDGSECYTWRGIEVEHHAAFAALCAPKAKKYLETMEVECGFAESLLAGDSKTSVLAPSPMLNLVLLNAHILRHVMGRGIGLRQLCDMARAYHSLMPMVDGYRLQQAYFELSLWRWSALLHSFLVERLGLNPDCLPQMGSGKAQGAGDYPQAYKKVAPDALTRIILKGGNFGKYDVQNNNGAESPFTHKLKTLVAFAERLPFSLRYAKGEAFFTVATLLRGQWRR